MQYTPDTVRLVPMSFEARHTLVRLSHFLFRNSHNEVEDSL